MRQRTLLKYYACVEPQNRKQAVGRCIYCTRHHSQPLTDEHIVPLGLGGRAILPSASCEIHQKDTCRIEGRALRTWFGPLRIYLDLPTRRRQERPKTLTLATWKNGGLEQREVAPKMHPFWFPMWDFQKKPGLLGGDRQDNLGSALLYMLCPPELMNPGTQVVVPGTFDSTVLSQMLAKIAHAYAVSELGLDSFEPLLLDLILSKHKPEVEVLTNRLVGGLRREEWPTPTNNLHELGLNLTHHDNATYLIATIRLFSYLETPIYKIVVGRTSTLDSASFQASVAKPLSLLNAGQ